MSREVDPEEGSSIQGHDFLTGPAATVVAELTGVPANVLYRALTDQRSTK